MLKSPHYSASHQVSKALSRFLLAHGPFLDSVCCHWLILGILWNREAVSITAGPLTWGRRAPNWSVRDTETHGSTHDLLSPESSHGKPNTTLLSTEPMSPEHGSGHKLNHLGSDIETGPEAQSSRHPEKLHTNAAASSTPNV